MIFKKQKIEMKVKKQLCTFYVNGFYFGVDVLRVQEVIKYQKMTPVPVSPAVVKGLINLRGQIVIAVDMREKMGMPPRENQQLPMNVVVHSDEGAISLLVDKIGDVIEVDDKDLEAPPDSLNGVNRDLLLGVYKLPKTLLLSMNVDEAINICQVMSKDEMQSY